MVVNGWYFYSLNWIAPGSMLRSLPSILWHVLAYLVLTSAEVGCEGDSITVTASGLSSDTAVETNCCTSARVMGGPLIDVGAQLGVNVTPHPEGQVEIGYYPLRPTAAGLELVPEWPDHAYQWHREGFELPDGAVLLAEGEAFANQAFRYGDTAYGIQFHPEVTHAMVHRWTVRASHRLDLPGAQSRNAQLEARLVHDRAVAAWLDRFLDRWLCDGINPLKN